MSSDALAPYRRLTIKIGSALLVDGKTGKLRAEWLASLAEKPEILVLNKIDALDADEIKEKLKVLKRASKGEVFTASGATGINVPEVLWKVLGVIDADKAAAAELVRRKDEPTWVP